MPAVPTPLRFLLVIAGLALVLLNGRTADPVAPARTDTRKEFTTLVRAHLQKYCLGCHSTKAKKGSLDLERFTSLDVVRKDLKPWQQTIEMLEAGEMPPKGKPQPTAEERKQLIAWVRGFLDGEARARAGDPGYVPLRRLSNAEYDYTIRDLCRVDLKPAREFPADGAAGEGFANAAEALSDISPTLLGKYLNASKSIAEHAVLLPDGFRFSLGKTRRDWTDESLARLRKFYAEYAVDGRLPLQPYLSATIRHREALLTSKTTVADVARQEKLSPRYLALLWQTLTDNNQKSASPPLDAIRARWRQAGEKEAGALAADISSWQTALWKFVKIGSYIHGDLRQLPSDPAANETQALRVTLKPAPDQNEVVLYLVTRELSPGAMGGATDGKVVWQRPRFERAGNAAKPLLLRDYYQFGPMYELNYATVFDGCSRYLTAAAAAQNPKQSVEELAKTHAIDAPFLKRWIEVLALEPRPEREKNEKAGSPKAVSSVIPPKSLLGLWRVAATDPARQDEARKLAEQVQTLLTGARPGKDNDPDRILYDNFVTAESALFKEFDASRLGKPRPHTGTYGLPKEHFVGDDASLVVPANQVTEVRLPATLFRDHAFVVDAKRDAASGDRVVQVQVLTAPPEKNAGNRWDGKSAVVGNPSAPAYKQLLQGYADFRRVFPTFVCFAAVVPTDEVVCLKMYHREDELLSQLVLDEDAKRRLDRLWEEHRFISEQPVAEHKYLPQFIGFVTQDQPKEVVTYFEGQRDNFRKRAEAFEKDREAALAKQQAALLDFAARAYRRPLQEKEKAELTTLYRALREKGVGHEEAYRGVLARVLVAPAFLFRIEHAPPGAKPGPINDWELATRLSYFLWSAPPDAALRQQATAGRLRDPKVLAEQTRRMLQGPQVRALAIEFGTQWLHVRGFDDLKEKNEKLFPTFDAKLRAAIYEESILFFQDLFQADRSVTQILDADHTFLNETLARHYEIPGIKGEQWRRVEGVRKHGRGGILGLASVQTKQAGASRTSPVLRGNWVVETLLGEKLPRPPANVPRLPEEEGGTDHLTVRQLVEKHARAAECAVCHQRIDPFGFALERYDPIGRRRDKDLGGLAIDTRARLKDGTEFEGIDGLRTYLLTKKKDVIVKLFCRKLLGYALGRAITLSDHGLIDEMVLELNRNDGRLSAAVLAVVRSPQFTMIRGSEFGNEN
jgi:mono/diheme cytochrome c family protein